MTDEGAEINSLLLFLIMSLRGTNRGIGTERGKGSLIMHSRVPWQSPERVPLEYNKVIATKSVSRIVPFRGMFRLHFVPLNMTQSNFANC